MHTDTTQVLIDARQGHKEALDQIVPRIHGELKQIAHRLLRRRPAGGVLDTTELVHEAYLKLVDHSRVEWSDKAHFQALSARAMRQILVDHFRQQNTKRHGGHLQKVTFDQGKIPIKQRGSVLIALDDAIDKLRDTDERLAQVVTYRFFGGMSFRAIADVLDLSTRTIRRDWRTARAWLHQQLTADPDA